SHVPLQTRKPIATVATPMLDFTGLGILQEALIFIYSYIENFCSQSPNLLL
ncbi:hypothetical protein AAKU64_004384, partial [Undibacterium sp. GrIS 1.8]